MTNAQLIHICNSHKPTRNPKIAKEYAFSDLKKEKTLPTTIAIKTCPSGHLS